MTGDIATLRDAIEWLPDDASIIVETSVGWKFKFIVVKAFAIGTETDNPALVLRIQPAPEA